MSSLKEIAKHCGKSYSTVSRSFDPQSRVGAETRKLILEYANEINYRPNLIAQSLKKHKTNIVGIIIPTFENIFYIELLQKVEIALKNCGYRLLVSFVQSGVSSARDCLELMAASQVDVVIIFPQDQANRVYIENLNQKLQVFQLLNAPFSNIDSLVMNDIQGARMGTRYLLNRGHRRILYLGGADRVSGFVDALNEYNVSLNEVQIAADWTSTEKTYNIIRDFRPTAVFAIAYMAESAWNAIRALNLSIPNDISLIAYDNTKWISMLEITAVAHDLENIAALMVDQLMFRLRNPTGSTYEPRHIILNPFIKERRSVKNIYD